MHTIVRLVTVATCTRKESDTNGEAQPDQAPAPTQSANGRHGQATANARRSTAHTRPASTRLPPAGHGSTDIRHQAESLGVVRWYWTFAVFVSFANSAFEEYYFRAFFLGRTRGRGRGRLSGRHGAALLNGLVFGLHHVFVLAGIVHSPWLVGLLAFGTMAGGYHWSMLRVRGYSIVDCWISHVIGDMALMYIGWTLLRAA